MAKTAKGTGEDNRLKIIETGVRIIGEKGVDKTSLSQISKAAGLSKGTIYYYYASKDELIFDIADLHMERISQTLMGMIKDNTPSWESLLTAFFETLLTSEARSRLHLYLVREAVSGNELLKKRFKTTYAQWFAMVDHAQKKMPGKPSDIAEKSRFLVALVDGFILQVLLEADPPPVKKIVKQMLRVMDPVSS